jgi:hypothetical protein
MARVFFFLLEHNENLEKKDPHTPSKIATPISGIGLTKM